MSNPIVFFDIAIGGKPAGRIEMTHAELRGAYLFYTRRAWKKIG